MSGNEPSSEPFDAPYWNILQVIAWAYIRDRSLVEELAEGAPWGVFRRELKLPGGDLRVIDVPADPHATIYIEMIATQKGGSAIPSLDAAIGEIWHALQTECLNGLGTKNGVGDLRPIKSHEWASLKFDDQENVAVPTSPRSEATIWRDLKFRSTEVLGRWPDLLASVRSRQAIWEPPEALTDSALEGWIRHDAWTALEAMFIAHGYSPRNAANADDEIFTHFVQGHTYLQRALKFGTVGKRVTTGKRNEWMDTPVNWIGWALSKGLSVDDRLREWFARLNASSSAQTKSEDIYANQSAQSEPEVIADNSPLNPIADHITTADLPAIAQAQLREWLRKPDWNLKEATQLLAGVLPRGATSKAAVVAGYDFTTLAALDADSVEGLLSYVNRIRDLWETHNLYWDGVAIVLNPSPQRPIQVWHPTAWVTWAIAYGIVPPWVAQAQSKGMWDAAGETCLQNTVLRDYLKLPRWTYCEALLILSNLDPTSNVNWPSPSEMGDLHDIKILSGQPLDQSRQIGGRVLSEFQARLNSLLAELSTSDHGRHLEILNESYMIRSVSRFITDIALPMLEPYERVLQKLYRSWTVDTPSGESPAEWLDWVHTQGFEVFWENWARREGLLNLTSSKPTTGAIDDYDDLAAEFPAVEIDAIAKVFHLVQKQDSNLEQWRKLAKNAKRNGLLEARSSNRVGRIKARFNPWYVGNWLVGRGAMTEHQVHGALKKQFPDVRGVDLL